MLVLDARFTVLAIIGGLATQWAVPDATVHAAAISRTPHDRGSSYNSQHVLPSWSGKGRPGSSKGRHERRWKHKVRMNDFHPFNPFGRIVDGLFSKLKRPHGHHKRSHSSILIPSHHGVTYVSHSRRGGGGAPLWRQGKHADGGANDKRGDDSIEGVVAIKSNDEVLGYLDATKNEDGGYDLNASENNKTSTTLHKLPRIAKRSVTGAVDEILVALQIHLHDIEAASNPLCATYSSSPSEAQVMTVTDCVDQTAPARTAQSGSQTFLYNPDTGGIRPTWFSGEDDGTDDTPAAAQAADLPSSSSSSAFPSVTSTNSSSASAIGPNAAAANGTQPSNGAQTNSTTALNSRAAAPASAQNVTMVFVPVKSGASAADVDTTAIDAQNSTVAASEAASATTTRTVTVFAVSSSSTASNNAATAASASFSSIGVELVSGTPSPAIASSTPSAQALASSSGSSVQASVVAASVTPAPSSSINAAAVASSLAASASSARSLAAAAASLASASANSSASGSATPAAVVSASASSTSTADGSSSTFVAAVVEREPAPEPMMTGVSTEPYQWSFAPEERL